MKLEPAAAVVAPVGGAEHSAMSVADPQPAAPKTSIRWFCLTPGRVVVALLAVEGLLWLSNWLGWPTWHKGYAVLSVVAVVGLSILLMLLWFILALVSRFRFQFSVRSLLTLTIAVAIPCSWLVVEMKQARKQRELVDVVNKSGGSFVYEAGVLSPETLFETMPPTPSAPQWLSSSLGDAFFDDVHWIGVKSPRQATDDWLNLIKDGPTIKGLDLEKSAVTDGGLERLQGLSQLEFLVLTDTGITGDGLVHLQMLPRLKQLLLEGTQITDFSLKYLRPLSRLEGLNLKHTKITDAGLQHIEPLTHLRGLNLSNTRVTDNALKYLHDLSQLEWAQPVLHSL